MIRKIITIDEEKCNGCGLCASACHEGAIGIVSGKAKLLREDYCDGLGDCLPACPTGAISFEVREALAYDEVAVKKAQAEKSKATACQSLPCGCPGTNSKVLKRDALNVPLAPINSSRLNQWPVQIKLLPIRAPYYDNANLLVAADCTAFAYGNFHNEFIRNRVTLIGCPKLDMVDYADKLTAIIKNNNIRFTNKRTSNCNSLLLTT